MMRANSCNMIRILCMLGIGYLGLYLGHPHSALADLGCSNATLKGTYIFAQSGWQIDADNGLCRKFCLGGRAEAVAPVGGGIKRPGSRTIRP